MKRISMLVLVFIILAGIGYFSFKQKNNDAINNSASNEVKLSKLKVLTTNNTDPKFLFEYAKDNGIYEKYGVDAELIIGEKGLLDILTSGEADVLMGGVTRPLTSYFNSGNTRLLANTNKPFEFYGVSRFSKEEKEKIKVVATDSTGGELEFITRFALKEMGIDIDKLTLVNVPSHLAKIEMLKKGELDFAIVSPGKILDQADAKNTLTVYEPEEILKNAPISRSLIVTSDAVEKKSSELEKFVLATKFTRDEVLASEDKVVDYLVSKQQFSKEEAEDIYSRFSESAKNIDFIPSVEDVSVIAEEVKKTIPSMTEKQIDLSGFIFDDFAKKAN